MDRTLATAEASLADMREARKLGMAIAAMIKMIATTIRSSISENPACLFLIEGSQTENSPLSSDFSQRFPIQEGAFAGPNSGRVARSNACTISEIEPQRHSINGDDCHGRQQSSPEPDTCHEMSPSLLPSSKPQAV